MFADPKETAPRRLRRQLKAGVSILVAVAAGAWLATRSAAAQPGASPSGPDARVGPDGGRASDASTDAARDASRDSGLVVRDAGRRNTVDRHEHRHGMPVRDNLLE